MSDESPAPCPPYRRIRWRIEPILGGLALVALFVGSVMVMKPFLSALMWAIVLAYALSPLQRKFTRMLRGSRTAAACLVTLTLTLVVVGPLTLLGFSLAEDGKGVAKGMREWVEKVPEEAPPWVQKLPIVGEDASGMWEQVSENRSRWLEEVERRSRDKRVPKNDPVAEPGIPVSDTQPSANGIEPEMTPRVISLLGSVVGVAQKALVGLGLALGRGISQVLMSGFLLFFILRDSEKLTERLRVAVARLAGERGRHLLDVAGQTVNAVVYGILGTAVVQAIVAWIGFMIAGVPGAFVLGALTFFFATIPFGAPLIWVPAAIWLFAKGETGWGVFLLIWGGAGISFVDNIVRPMLISHGSKLPFALILCGVIGGAMAFGLVGVFLGPVLLAVAFRLVSEWSELRTDGTPPRNDEGVIQKTLGPLPQTSELR